MQNGAIVYNYEIQSSNSSSLLPGSSSLLPSLSLNSLELGAGIIILVAIAIISVIFFRYRR